MTDIFAPLTFSRGPALANRLMLAPLTNLQSHDDGELSEEEYTWLRMRGEGGFGLVMTCAAFVTARGKGFPGQLGIHDDTHLPMLVKLASTLRAAGSVSSVQIQHSGIRALPVSDAPLLAPFADEKTGARAMTTGEVQQLVEDFILAGVRADKAGFDGIEVHGAHGYMLCEFLDIAQNTRADQYGGTAENRHRIFFEIIDGLRARVRDDFQIGVRLSPERFGMDLGDCLALAEKLMTGGTIDFLDMSLWDVAKYPEDKKYADKTLFQHFAGVPRGSCRLGVAGKIMSGDTVRACLSGGADFVMIGRGGILHHDFPKRLAANPEFVSAALPVTRDHLAREGLSEKFIGYMSNWDGFVAS